MRILKLLFKLIAFLVAVGATLLLTLLILLQFERSRHFLFKKAIESAEKASGMTIEEEGTRYLFPYGFSIDKLSGKKGNQPVFVLSELTCELSPFKAFEGRLVFRTLFASELSILSFPESEKIEPKKKTSRLPLPLTIEKLKIDRIQIPSTLLPILQDDFIFSLEGTFKQLPLFFYPKGHFLIGLKTKEYPPLSVSLLFEKEQIHFEAKAKKLALSASTSFQNLFAFLDKQNEKPIEFLLEGEETFANEPLSFKAKARLNKIDSIFIDLLNAKSPLFSLQGSALINGFSAIENGKLEGTLNTLSVIDGSALFHSSFSGPFDQIALSTALAIHSSSYKDKIQIEGIIEKGNQIVFDSIKTELLNQEIKGTASWIKQEYKLELSSHSLEWKAATLENIALDLKAFKDEGKETFKIESHLKGEGIKKESDYLNAFDANLKADLKAQSPSIEKLVSSIQLLDFKWQDLKGEKAEITALNNGQDVTDFTIKELRADFATFPLEMIKPIHLQLAKETISHIEGELNWKEAPLSFTFIRENEKIEAELSLSSLPFEQLHFLTSLHDLKGLASIQAKMEGPVLSPKGTFEIEFEKLHIEDPFFKEKPGFSGFAKGSFDTKQTEIEGEVKGNGLSPLKIQGELPFAFDPALYTFSLLKDREMSLQANAQGEINPFLDFFSSDLSTLSGQALLKVFLKGTLLQPKISGSLELTNGSYENPNTGGIFQNISAKIEGEGSSIHLKEFHALDENKGTITASGVMQMDPAARFPFEGKIALNSMDLVHSDYAFLSGLGELFIKGNMDHAKLEGTLKIDEASIHLEQTLPQEIKTVETITINNSYSPSDLSRKEGDKKNFLTVDISLELPENLVISGNNIQSTWKGKVLMSGTVDDPLFEGNLHLVKGEYNLSGRVFQLTQGNIHFGGPLKKKTTLYIVAARDIDTIQAEIIVKGPVSKPVVSFRSNPPMSQREVLSYILFNRGFSDITTDQGAQLTHSFIELQTSDEASSSSDLLSRLRNKIGIDRLDFSNTGEGGENNYSLQVGKNITDSVSFSFNKSILDALYRYSLEVKLRQNLKLQAEVGVGDAYQLKTSIKWKKDY